MTCNMVSSDLQCCDISYYHMTCNVVSSDLQCCDLSNYHMTCNMVSSDLQCCDISVKGSKCQNDLNLNSSVDAGVIRYFDPHGILTLGSIFI
jgi:hypothetical protein